jgi:hypothetical protein
MMFRVAVLSRTGEVALTFPDCYSLGSEGEASTAAEAMCFLLNSPASAQTRRAMYQEVEVQYRPADLSEPWSRW